jgi:zinc protease
MAQRYKLDNGLTVVFEEQHAAKVAAFQVWVNAGSADERPDQAGLAHLHEHMLFKGTELRGPGEIARDIEGHGGEVNAWTSFDQTVYHVVMASQFAKVGLDILADAVRRSLFDGDELAREIEVVCEEIKRSFDSPQRRASQQLFSTAYRTHPYQLPVIGTETSVRSFTREKVLEFYKRHYAPKNMVVSATGDFTEKELRAWVDAAFGGAWDRTYSGRDARAQEPAPSGRRIVLKEDDIKEVYTSLAFHIPEVSHADMPALEVLASIAGQGEASRLSLEVKRKRSLVNSIDAFAYTPRDPGLFGISATLKPENAKAALEATVRVLQQLRHRGPLPEELATVKGIVESEAVYQRESVQGLARKLGYYECTLGGIEKEAQYYERVAQLTTENIREVAEKYLRFDRAIFTALQPKDTPLTSADVEEVLNRVALEETAANTARKSPGTRAENPTPMRITAPLSARKGTSGIIVEKLSNGAKVVIREESAVPLFAIRAFFHGGLRYETTTNNGVTVLLSRLLTRGTPTHDAEQISHSVDDMAGSLSGMAGRSSISMRGEFLSRHFDRGFDLFAECLTQPTLPEAELDREKALTLQAIHTREDKPSALAFDIFGKALYQKHPYRMSQLGEVSTVEAITPQTLRDYHDAYLDPTQLTLCVVGDVKTDAVMAQAERYFGKTRGKAKPAPVLEVDPPPATALREKKVLQKAQSHLVLGFQGARIFDPWRYALEVLSTVLSGQGGRLFVELRDKKSLAYSVSSMSVESFDPGYFAVYMGTSPEKVDQALEGIRAELDQVRQTRISDLELERARRNLIGTHEIGLQRNASRAAAIGLDVCYGLGVETFLRYADEIGAVTAEQVQDVAQRVLTFDRSALVIVGP